VTLQKRAEVTRAAIIDGAAKAFEALGYGNTSLTDVAGHAEVTKGALYFHFKSKEDLAMAVIDEQHARVRMATQEILDRDLPALTAMVLMCREFGHQLCTDPVVQAGIRLTLEASAFGHAVRGPYEDWITVMEELVRTAQIQGDVRPELRASALARFIVASFTGVQMVSDVLTEREDVMERIEDMWAVLTAGVVPSERMANLGTLLSPPVLS
jgi:AcrR family transcriptional regulator